MAASCSRGAVPLTSSILTRSAAAASKQGGMSCAKPASAPRFAFPKLKPSRVPLELGGVQSLMPLHSVTASALLNSLLSSAATWTSLSEGLATPP